MNERQGPTESELSALLQGADVRAPEALHARVREMVDERGMRARGSAIRLGGSLAAAAAIVVVAVVLLGSGSSSRLTVSQTAALTLRAPTEGAPARNPLARGQLADAVDGVAFPYWSYAFGFRARGARTDTIAGHRIVTVFYANSRGQSIGYAIAAGAAGAIGDDGRELMREGTDYRVLDERGVHVVTWTRGGDLCVLSARDVPVGQLVALASWRTTAA